MGCFKRRTRRYFLVVGKVEEKRKISRCRSIEYWRGNLKWLIANRILDGSEENWVLWFFWGERSQRESFFTWLMAIKGVYKYLNILIFSFIKWQSLLINSTLICFRSQSEWISKPGGSWVGRQQKRRLERIWLIPRCCGGCRKFFCFSFGAILCRDINWQMRFFLPTRQRQGNFHFDHKRHATKIQAKN